MKTIEIVLKDYKKISVIKSTCDDDALEYIKRAVDCRDDAKYLHCTIDDMGCFLYQLSLYAEIKII